MHKDFLSLVQQLNIPDVKAQLWYNKLVAAYMHPSRMYHNMAHITSCLHEVRVSPYSYHEPIVHTAIWFHDVNNSVLESMNQASNFIKESTSDRVKKLYLPSILDTIAATNHTGWVPSTDAALVVDADLSILGKDTKTFWEYDESIQKEYAQYPLSLVAHKRVDILKKFQERNVIYNTPHFILHYEQQARINIDAAIKKWSDMCY